MGVGVQHYRFQSLSLSSFHSFHPFRIDNQQERGFTTYLGNCGRDWKTRASLGSATPFCFWYSGSTWALMHELSWFWACSYLRGCLIALAPNARSSYRNQVRGLRQEKGDGEQLDSSASNTEKHCQVSFALSFPLSVLIFSKTEKQQGVLACEQGRLILSDLVSYLLWYWQK